MSRRPLLRPLLWGIAMVGPAALFVAACSSGKSDDTLALDVVEKVRVAVGETREQVLDPEGLEWTARGLPPGAELDDNTLRWTPTDAGSWVVELAATDGEDNMATATTSLFARYPARPEALVALGDSVASGQGLDRSDYLLGDPCWRAEDDSYPARVLDRWRDGDPGAEPELALVACSGAEVEDLLGDPVTGGFDGTAPDDTDKLSQLEWAVRANRALVTITIGANDMKFTEPERYLDEGQLDTDLIGRRTTQISGGLEAALTRLVDATDARIVVSTYHDPTATSPQGVDGCPAECFAEAADRVIDRLDETIEGAVARFATDRVAVADVRKAFEGHRAPNGIGPDGVRAGEGLGRFGVFFERTTGTTQAYCAEGHPSYESWLNSVDCVHPDGQGANAYADAVWRAAERLGEAGWPANQIPATGRRSGAVYALARQGKPSMDSHAANVDA